MRYDYECRECEYAEEIIQSIHEESLTICPKCNSETFRRVINSAPAISVKNYETIGSLADRNWKEMGTYEKDSKVEKDGLDKIAEKKEAQNKKTKLANLSEKGKKKYIETGEL